MITNIELSSRIRELLKYCAARFPDFTDEDIHDWVYKKIQKEEFYTDEEMEFISEDIWERLEQRNSNNP